MSLAVVRGPSLVDPTTEELGSHSVLVHVHKELSLPLQGLYGILTRGFKVVKTDWRGNW